jgi:hypothetical protein
MLCSNYTGNGRGHYVHNFIFMLIIACFCLHSQFRFKGAKVEVMLNLDCVILYVVIVIVWDVIWENIYNSCKYKDTWIWTPSDLQETELYVSEEYRLLGCGAV